MFSFLDLLAVYFWSYCKPQVLSQVFFYVLVILTVVLKRLIRFNFFSFLWQPDNTVPIKQLLMPQNKWLNLHQLTSVASCCIETSVQSFVRPCHSYCLLLMLSLNSIRVFLMVYNVFLYQVPADESSLSAYDDTSSTELNNAGSERETGTSCSSGRMSAVDTNPGYCSNWAFLKVRWLVRSCELDYVFATDKMAIWSNLELNVGFK